MFHKELAQRIKTLESQVRDLQNDTHFTYWPNPDSCFEYQELKVAHAIQRICEYLNIEFGHKPKYIEEEDHFVRKTKLPKKPKKKAKKKK